MLPGQAMPPAGLPGVSAREAAALTLAQRLEIITAQAGEIAQLREQIALLQERLN
jgi:hypothetical protein